MATDGPPLTLDVLKEFFDQPFRFSQSPVYVVDRKTAAWLERQAERLQFQHKMVTLYHRPYSYKRRSRRRQMGE